MSNAFQIPVEFQSENSIKELLSGIEDGIKQLNKTLSNIAFPDSFKQSANKSTEAVVALNTELQNTRKQSEETGAKLVGAFTLATAGALTFSGKLAETIVRNEKNIESFGRSISQLSGALTNLGGFATNVAGAFKSFSNFVFDTDRTIIGLKNNAQILGIGLLGLGTLLKKTDSDFLQFIGTVSLLASVIVGNFALAIQKAVVLVGEFVFSVGSKMVEAVQDSIKVFLGFEKQAFTLNRTIDLINNQFSGSLGSLEQWEQDLLRIKEASGETETTLKKATVQILSSSKSLGLNREELIKLLEIATDYNALVGGDLVDTTKKIIGGLNGQTITLSELGLSLNDSAAASNTFNINQKAQFEALTESSKIQARYDLLLKEHSTVLGVANTLTETHEGRQKALKSAIEDVNVVFGRGADRVESIALQTRLYTALLNSLNPTLVEAAGFLTALGGRILQVTGFVVALVFQISVFVTVWKTLNAFLASEAGLSLLNKNIIGINKSFIELLALMGATSTNITSLGGVFKAFGQAALAQLDKVSLALTGLNTANLTLFGALQGVGQRALQGLAIGFSAIGSALRAILLNPIVLGITTAVVVFLELKKAFLEIEARTGALSKLWEVFKSTLEGASPIFDFISEGFGKIVSFFKEMNSKIFGLVVSGLTKVIKGVAEFAKTFDLIPKDKLNQVDDAISKLDQLDKQLSLVGYDIRQIPKDAAKAGRSLASEFDSKAIDELRNKLDQLRKDIAAFSQTNITKIADEFKARRDIITESVKFGLIKESEAQDLIAKIKSDANKKAVTEVLSGIEEVKKTGVQKAIEQQQIALSELKQFVAEGIVTTEQAAGVEKRIRIATANEIAKEQAKIREAQLAAEAARLKEFQDQIKAGVQALAGAISIVVDVSKGERDLQEFKARIPSILSSFEAEGQKVIKGLESKVSAQLDLVKLAADEEGKKKLANITAEQAKKLKSIDQAAKAQLASDIAAKEADFRNGLITIDQLNAAKVAIETESTRKLAEDSYNLNLATEQLIQDQKIQNAKDIEEAVSSKRKQLEAEISAARIKLEEDIAKKRFELQEQLAQKELEQAKKIEESAGKAAGSLIGAITDYFVPGIGSSVAAITSGLASGSAFLTNAVQGIVDALPKIFNNLLEALPKIVTSLVEAAPSIVFALIQAIVNNISPIISALSSLMPKAAIAFADALIKNAPNIVFQLMKGLVEGIINSFIELLNLIPFVDIPPVKLARGGEVPNGFMSDNFPASLTSGELVVDRSTTGELQRFLADQNKGASGGVDADRLERILSRSSEKNLSIVIKVGERELAETLVSLNRQGFRTI